MMSYYKKMRVLALVSLALTIAALFGAISSAYWDFSQAVVLSFVTLTLLVVTTLLFNGSIDRGATSPARVEPLSEATPDLVAAGTLTPVTTPADQQTDGASKGTVVLVFACISGGISLIAYLDGSRFTGSGSMGGLLDYVVLAVSVPATLILGLIGLVMKLSESNK